MELRGEELSRYLNSQFVGLWKCLYDHWLANKAYFSDIAVKNIYQSFTHKMAAKPAGIENTSLSHYVKITPSYYVRTMSARWAHGVCCSWIGSHTWLRALSNGGIADDWVTLTTMRVDWGTIVYWRQRSGWIYIRVTCDSVKWLDDIIWLLDSWL